MKTVASDVVKQVVAPVAKSVATHTIEFVNERIDKNLEANDRNDKTYAITDIQAGQCDSLDALISTKITRGNNNDTALPLATSIDTTKIEKTLLATSSDTPEGTPTNGLVEPLTIVILSDADITIDSDTQNEDNQPAVIFAAEQGYVPAFTAWVDTKNTLNMDYRRRTAVMLCTGASYRL